MDMKRFFQTGAAALIAATSLVSCEKPADNGYEGTNYIYLSADNTSMYGIAGSAITVNVMLTTALDYDAEITFEVENGDGIVELSGNPVSIPAGSTTASFEIACVDDIVLEQNVTCNVVLGESAANPEGINVRDPFSFTVMVADSGMLTDEQQAIIDAFRESTGIDLSKYIGLIDVSMVYTGTDPSSGEPLAPETIKGQTLVTLSEASETGKPVLKMLSNPMGIQDKMYEALRTVTVDNTDYWYAEYALPCYGMLMSAINWTSTSDEVFTMSLDNITINADGTADFLGEGRNQYDDPITIVPFGYSFSAYDRELAAIADGTLDIENTPEWAGDCTANPAYHLNCDDISADAYEVGNWTEAEASVSNESMVFTFCVYRCNFDYDYTRVVATYTPAE